MDAIKGNTPFDYRSKLSFEQKQLFRKKFSEKSVIKGVLWNLIYLGSIYATFVICFYLANTNYPYILKIISIFCAVLFCTRQMRGLENIVHFGSHNNFSKNKQLNDRLTNILAAWPMLQNVKDYRSFHSTHHGEFASHVDPCRIRLEKIGANTQKIENNTQLLWMILKWMPQYQREFYREIKSNSMQLGIFMTWHTLVGIIIYFVHSWQLALFSIIFWIAIMFVCLPFLRSIAELSEHDYELGNNVSETTFNNLGLLDHLLIHPAGDAWHSLHHLHPTISWWKQGAAHKFLMKYDSAYRKVINRDKIIQDLVQFPTLRKEAA